MFSSVVLSPFCNWSKIFSLFLEMANPSPGILWPVETEVMVSPLYPCVAAGKIGSVSLETHLQDNLVADKDVKKPTKQTNFSTCDVLYQQKWFWY